MEGTETRRDTEEEGEPCEQESGQTGAAVVAGDGGGAPGRSARAAVSAAARAQLRRGGAGPHALSAAERLRRILIE